MTDLRSKRLATEPLHHQVAGDLRRNIEAGHLPEGAPLPSTRKLAKEYGVSQYTIQSAMNTLTRDGYVHAESRSKRTVALPRRRRTEPPIPTNQHVIMVGGFAGSGKTELGRVLGRRTGWAMLDKDTISRPIVEGALRACGADPNDRDTPLYWDHIRPTEYAALVDAGLENAECGSSAILAAPFVREFSDPAWLTRTTGQFANLGATVTLVWVYCDADTMHLYLRRRNAARDAGKLSDWEGYLASIDVDRRPAAGHVVVDNSAGGERLDDQAARLLSNLQS